MAKDKGLTDAQQAALYFSRKRRRNSTPEVHLDPAAISENASAATVIGALSVTRGNGTYTFTISSDPDSKFSIVAGNLVLAGALNYENKRRHSVIIQADNGVDTPLIQSITVDVLDIPEAPVNLSAPVVSGVAVVGNVLSSTTGLWTDPVSGYTYQWRRGGVDIGSANNSTYVLTHADVGSLMSCVVVASSAGGSGTPTASNNTSAVQEAPTNSVAPSISGDPLVGGTLTVVPGTWVGTPSPSFTYQWRRNGAAIGGETATTFDVTVTDVGATISVTETGTNVIASVDATSASVGPVAVEGTPPNAPLAAWDSGGADDTPNFEIQLPTNAGDATDAAVDDVLVGEYQTQGGDWSSPTTYISHTLISGDLVEGATIDVEADPIADGDYDFRFRLERFGTVGSDWTSDIEVTITTGSEIPEDLYLRSFANKSLADAGDVALRAQITKG